MKSRSPAETEELVARAARYNGVFALVFVGCSLIVYAAGDSRSGFWHGCRTVIMWTMPLYLFLVVSGVLVGMFTIWGARTAAIRKTGYWAVGMAIGSMALLLTGKTLLGS